MFWKRRRKHTRCPDCGNLLVRIEGKCFMCGQGYGSESSRRRKAERPRRAEAARRTLALFAVLFILFYSFGFAVSRLAKAILAGQS